MSRIHASATAVIDAPADHVYSILADYCEGHPRILPEKYFSGLEVERGGQGAGTIPGLLRRIYTEELMKLESIASVAVLGLPR